MHSPTADEKAGIRFYAPNTNRRQLVEKVKKWRGDHSRCSKGHRTGECVAAYGWTIDYKTWIVRPDFAGVSIEPNMMGSVIQNEGSKGAFPKPVWQAKGWVETEEAEGVKPTEEVLRFLIERLVNERKVTLEHKKAEYATVVTQCKELRAAAERANGLITVPEKKGKADG